MLRKFLGGVRDVADIDDIPWLSTRTRSDNGIREVPDVSAWYRAAGPKDVLGVVPGASQLGPPPIESLDGLSYRSPESGRRSLA